MNVQTLSRRAGRHEIALRARRAHPGRYADTSLPALAYWNTLSLPRLCVTDTLFGQEDERRSSALADG